MLSPTFLETVFSSLLNNPALVEFAAQADEKALAIFKTHFTFSAHEITKAYQKSFAKALEAISDELAQKRPSTPSRCQRRHRFTTLFAKQIKTASKGVQSINFVEPLKEFAKHKDKLFQLEKITEKELMALVK
jgi:hypothetical protein